MIELVKLMLKIKLFLIKDIKKNKIVILLIGMMV